MQTNRRAIQRSALKQGTDGRDIPGELRRRLGAWLREQREAAGLTQVELGEALGLDGGNGISAIENGRANIQPELYSKYSEALKLSQHTLAKVVLRHVDPWLYRAIFASREVALLEEIAAMTKKG